MKYASQQFVVLKKENQKENKSVMYKCRWKYRCKTL